MTVDIGIIGLPKSGKTTVFNALSGGKADTLSLAPNIGVAKVPETRLKVLAQMFGKKKIIPAEVRYIDIGASAPGVTGKQLIASQLLSEVSKADALLGVARSFTDDRTPHVSGSIDVGRDIATLDLELAFSDLAIIERRLERIDISLKAAKPQERQAMAKEQEMLGKVKSGLEKELPIRSMGLAPDELRALSNYQFLSAKPLLIVVNIGEEQLPQAAKMETDLSARFSRPHCRLITLCGKLEMELSQLEEADATKFRAEMGLKEPGLDRVIRQSYELLELISFFTIGTDEVKAWSIPNGMPAVKAAGKVHSDMERGFIRAEVIDHHDLVRSGNMAEARRRGLLRLEGKNYVVKDGDVINFLFNV